MHFHTVHGLTVWCQTQRNGSTPAVEVEDNLMTLESCGSLHERVQPFHLDRIYLKKCLRFNPEQPCTNTFMHHLGSRNVACGAIEQLGSLPRLHVQEQPSDQIMQAVPELTLQRLREGGPHKNRHQHIPRTLADLHLHLMQHALQGGLCYSQRAHTRQHRIGTRVIEQAARHIQDLHLMPGHESQSSTR